MAETTQLNLIDQPATKTAAATLTRKCDECGKDFTPGRSDMRFCSTKCRNTARHKRDALIKSETSRPGKQREPALLTPAITGLSPQLQIAVDLLKKEAERWEKMYDEQKAKAEKFEGQLRDLERATMKKEHEAALHGLEKAKPDVLDRLANMPEHVTQLFAPLVSKLGSFLLPDAAGAPMAGVNGQLDEVQLHLLTWINSLPEPLQQKCLQILATLTHLDGEQLATVFNGFQNLLQKGTTLNVNPIDETMYGS